MFSCFSCGGNNSQRGSSVKFQQYYVQGEVLYKKYCSNCHQEKGDGLGRLYPPVNQSDFIDGNINNVICIIKYGRSGPLVVNGIEYNMEMKGNPQLTELEVAEIATYLYNSWGRDKGLIDVKMVTEILPDCDL
jgi:cytochrome c551